MPSAKQLLAKLTRFLHRIKPSTTPRIIEDKQRSKKSQKASNTGVNPHGLPLNELSSMPMDNELQPKDKELKELKQLKTASKSATKRKQRSKHPSSAAANDATRSRGLSRMEAGYEDVAVQHGEGYELNEGPILETGISRMAFCRKLDSLLQRSLGVDVCNDRRWPKANGSYC